jgi:hypothetical protein
VRHRRRKRAGGRGFKFASDGERLSFLSLPCTPARCLHSLVADSPLCDQICAWYQLRETLRACDRGGGDCMPPEIHRVCSCWELASCTHLFYTRTHARTNTRTHGHTHSTHSNHICTVTDLLHQTVGMSCTCTPDYGHENTTVTPTLSFSPFALPQLTVQLTSLRCVLTIIL